MVASTNGVSLHEGLYDLGVESRIYLTAKHGSGDVETASNFALSEAVYELS